jgi:hypothetical protein
MILLNLTKPECLENTMVKDSAFPEHKKMTTVHQWPSKNGL